MDSIFYIKGVRPNGDIAIFNGYQNPYNISLDNPPKGFGYNNKNDAIDNKDCIKNPFVKIEWEIIDESEFIQLKIDWCKKYIEHYE